MDYFKRFESIKAFFSIIMRGYFDSRIFVKKAVNWALRQIWKQNLIFNKKAIEIAEKIYKIDFKVLNRYLMMY